MEIIIKIAEMEHHQDIRRLWELVFSEDSESFLDFYFSEVMGTNRVVIAFVKGQLVGMLHMNPYDVLIDEKVEKIYYIVGVATNPKFRRRGIMGQMMNAAIEIANLENIHSLILLPEDERLYTPFGFEFCSKYYSTTIQSSMYSHRNERDNSNYYELTVDEFCKYMPKDIENFTPIRTQSYLKHLYKELTSEGGKAMNINGNIILYYCEEVLEIQKLFMKAYRSQAEKDEAIEVLSSEVLKLANGIPILIHEANIPLLSQSFSYLRKNNYDVRDYMMIRKNRDILNTYIGFDEVI